MGAPGAVSTGDVSGFVELLEAQATAQPHATAFTYLEQGEEPAGSLTYADLDRLARRLAVRLQAQAAPGSRVLLVFPNRLEFIVAFMGCLYAGMVAVPVAPPWHSRAARHLARIAAQTDVAVVLAHSAFHDTARRRIAEPLGDRPVVWFGLDDLSSDDESAWQRPAMGRGTVAFLQYTSGSTGSPKGVMVSHGNLLHNCGLLTQAFAFETPFRLVSWLPFFHDWGLIGCLLFPLSQGRPSWFFEPAAFIARPQRWLRAIQRWDATLSCGPTFAYELCARQVTPNDRAGLDLGQWEVAMVGAEPVRWETLARFDAAFAPHGFRRTAFYPSYGLAESTLIVTGGRRAAPPVVLSVDRSALGRGQVDPVPFTETLEAITLVGCGEPLADQTVRIVDPDTGIVCAPGSVGELWVAGPSVAGGYWALPGETEATFGAIDSAGRRWLRTGDLGFLRDGELFVCGRVKDVIIVGGHNIFAPDVELAAAAAHAALRPGCGAAFGVDAAGAERMVLVHELNYGLRADLRQVIGAVQKALVAEFGVPADAIVLIKPGTLQKTSSGKIRRVTMREAFLAEQLEVVDAWRSW